LTGVSKVHKKTYNWLKESMNFHLIYKKGEEMPANYLSCHIFASISWQDQG